MAGPTASRLWTRSPASSVAKMATLPTNVPRYPKKLPWSSSLAMVAFHALNSTKTRIMHMDYFQGHLAFLSNNQSKWICNILCGLPYSHLLGGASTLPPSINVHHHMHSSHIYLCQHAAPVIICYHAFTIVEWCYQWTLSSMIHHQMFVEVDRTRGGWILA